MTNNYNSELSLFLITFLDFIDAENYFKLISTFVVLFFLMIPY